MALERLTERVSYAPGGVNIGVIAGVGDEALLRWFRFEATAEPLVAEMVTETAGVLASDAA